MNLGHPAYRTPKGDKGPQHAGVAGAGQVSYPNVPQDPRGKVRAGLLEAQSRSGYGSSPHHGMDPAS
jgi:hypothetical protein